MPSRVPSWMHEWGVRRRFRRSMRIANQGVRASFDTALSVRTQMWRLLVVLVLAVIVGSQLGPWGVTLRQEIGDRVGRFLPASISLSVLDAPDGPG